MNIELLWYSVKTNLLILIPLNFLLRLTLWLLLKKEVEDFTYLVKTEGLQLVEGNFTSGMALADANAWTLTFAGSEPEPAAEVLSSIISALLPE